MQGKTKPISLEEINKIEMRNDGKDFQRFNDLLKQVISVPKKDIDEQEKQSREKTQVRKQRI